MESYTKKVTFEPEHNYSSPPRVQRPLGKFYEEQEKMTSAQSKYNDPSDPSSSSSSDSQRRGRRMKAVIRAAQKVSLRNYTLMREIGPIGVKDPRDQRKESLVSLHTRAQNPG